MATWNPQQYLRFAKERTRPCRDLVARLFHDAPRRIIDLGCGPGNSTAVLVQRWPNADIAGIDSSDAMIAEARNGMPGRTFSVENITSWSPESQFDIVFSNATLQWVEGHEQLLPRLMGFVAPGGIFAAQMPCNMDAPTHRIMRELASSSEFETYLGTGVRTWHVHEPAFYYDILAPLTDDVDIWQTEYLHVLPNAEAIVEWYKGTGLRPYLDKLPDDVMRGRFLDRYLDAITAAYPAQRNGNVLLPFQRLFIVAGK
ncbi:MAG TPA: trans-aconitate 2-methyltransferase [Polyangium sp.]|nr:trans-aconitate 2-methyltransferase [Polyangium sp.]